MKIKLFHTSDLHLGKKFFVYHDKSKLLHDQRYKTLEKLVDIANEKECSFFIIAGDLFDSHYVAKKDILNTIKILNKFSGDAVLILPGNHDYYDSKNPGKVWENFIENSTDKLILLNKEKEYCFNNVIFYPAPCDAKHSSNNRLDWIKKINKNSDDIIHVGITHGSVKTISPDFDEQYFPMTLEELNSCFPDIWILGHTHKAYPETETTGKVFFAGMPEPDGFNCFHSGTSRIIEVDEHKNITGEIINTGKFFFVENKNIEINNKDDIKNLVDKYSNEKYQNAFLKLVVKGSLPAEDYQSKSDIYAKISKNVQFLKLMDGQLTRSITESVIQDEFTKNSFPYKLLMDLAQSGEDNEALQIAYELILEAKQ